MMWICMAAAVCALVCWACLMAGGEKEKGGVPGTHALYPAQERRGPLAGLVWGSNIATRRG